MNMNIDLVVVECASCNIAFGVPSGFHKSRRNDHKEFYCPNGHHNYYPQKSDVEKLRYELNMTKMKLSSKEAFLTSARESIHRQELAERKRIGTYLRTCFRAGAKTVSLRVVADHFQMKLRETLHTVRMAGYVCKKMNGTYQISKGKK